MRGRCAATDQSPPTTGSGTASRRRPCPEARTRRSAGGWRRYGELAELAKAKALVYVIGPVHRELADSCAALGAEVRRVPRLPFPVTDLAVNRLQLFAPAWEQDRDFLLLLDCDTLIVRDPLPLLRDDVFQAKIAPLPTVTMPALRHAFAHFGLSLPEPTYVHRVTRAG